MFSRFIHVVASVRISFFFKAEEYSIVWIYQILFIHSLADGHMGCFHLLAIVNNAAVNKDIQISGQDPAFSSFGYIPGRGVAGSYGNSLFNFLWNHQAIFHRGCTILHSHQQ